MSRLAATDTCKPKSGNTITWVSKASRKPTTTFVTASIRDMDRDCFIGTSPGIGLDGTERLLSPHSLPSRPAFRVEPGVRAWHYTEWDDDRGRRLRFSAPSAVSGRGGGRMLVEPFDDPRLKRTLSDGW